MISRIALVVLTMATCALLATYTTSYTTPIVSNGYVDDSTWVEVEVVQGCIDIIRINNEGARDFNAAVRIIKQARNILRRRYLGLPIVANYTSKPMPRISFTGSATFSLLWLLPFVAGYPLISLVRVVKRRLAGDRSGHCVKCDYNLTGNTSGRCPECGEALSAELASTGASEVE